MNLVLCNILLYHMNITHDGISFSMLQVNDHSNGVNEGDSVYFELDNIKNRRKCVLFRIAYI